MPVSGKDFLDLQAIIEHEFNLKHVPDMKRTSNQMYRTDKYSQQNSVIRLVQLNDGVFIYEQSGC